jgi:hypothetical protein
LEKVAESVVEVEAEIEADGVVDAVVPDAPEAEAGNDEGGTA